MKYSKFIFILILLISISCQKEVNINIDSIDQKLVVNCLFTENEYFNVRISKTLNVFDISEDKIENATISLFENDLFLENLDYTESGFYISNTRAKPNTNYTININRSDLPSVTANNNIPDKTIISDCRITDFHGYDVDGEIYSQLSFTFSNNGAINDYYELFIFIMSTRDNNGVTETRIKGVRPFGNDPVIINEGDLNYYPWFLPFSDKLINGKTYRMFINYYTPIRYDTGQLIDENYKVIIHFRSVSEEYYNYKKKLIKHTWNQTSDIWDGIGEPIQMYSNIENGYGIFAGYSVYIDTVQTGK